MKSFCLALVVVAGLQDPSPIDGRLRGAQSGGRDLRRSVADWIRQLGDVNVAPEASAQPFQELIRIGEPAVSGLIVALGDPKQRRRDLVARVLKHIEPDGQRAVPAMLELLRDSDAGRRVVAAQSLGDLCAPNPDDEPSSEPIREFMQTLTPQQAAALNGLIAALGDAHPEVRSQIICSLARWGVIAFTELQQSLRCGNTARRAWSAGFLGGLGT